MPRCGGARNDYRIVAKQFGRPFPAWGNQPLRPGGPRMGGRARRTGSSDVISKYFGLPSGGKVSGPYRRVISTARGIPGAVGLPLHAGWPLTVGGEELLGRLSADSWLSRQASGCPVQRGNLTGSAVGPTGEATTLPCGMLPHQRGMTYLRGTRGMRTEEFMDPTAATPVIPMPSQRNTTATLIIPAGTGRAPMMTWRRVSRSKVRLLAVCPEIRQGTGFPVISSLGMMSMVNLYRRTS